MRCRRSYAYQFPFRAAQVGQVRTQPGEKPPSVTHCRLRHREGSIAAGKDRRLFLSTCAAMQIPMSDSRYQVVDDGEPNMHVTYDPILVLFSIGVAILGAQTAFALTAGGYDRRFGAWRTSFALANSGLVMGLTSWAAHLVGLMAIKLPVPLGWAVAGTLGSIGVAIAGTGAGLYIARARLLRHWSIPAGALCVGASPAPTRRWEGESVGASGIRLARVARVHASSVGGAASSGLVPIGSALLQERADPLLGFGVHHVLDHHPGGVVVGLGERTSRSGGRRPPCRWRASPEAWTPGCGQGPGPRRALRRRAPRD